MSATRGASKTKDRRRFRKARCVRSSNDELPASRRKVLQLLTLRIFKDRNIGKDEGLSVKIRKSLGGDHLKLQMILQQQH